MKNVSLVVALASALAIAGCRSEPSGPRAQVGEAKEATKTDASAKVLTFGPPSSKIEFVGAKVTAKHQGSFAAFTGTVRLVDHDPTKSAVSVEIDPASVTTDTPKLTGHLKSPDFFDAEKFKKATFQSTSITAGGEGGRSHTVTGNLSLHGVTKSITFPANVKVEGDSVSVDADLVINRKDFGIVYPGMVDDLIKDDVTIKLTVRAAPQS